MVGHSTGTRRFHAAFHLRIPIRRHSDDGAVRCPRPGAERQPAAGSPADGPRHFATHRPAAATLRIGIAEGVRRG
ncbi:hypothetical protein G6F24_016729 [Rhizopus arrhizus]|nr:hypothetical protein G6F24_016729 [Rhizopus arrhizus]